MIACHAPSSDTNDGRLIFMEGFYRVWKTGAIDQPDLSASLAPFRLAPKKNSVADCLAHKIATYTWSQPDWYAAARFMSMEVELQSMRASLPQPLLHLQCQCPY